MDNVLPLCASILIQGFVKNYYYRTILLCIFLFLTILIKALVCVEYISNIMLMPVIYIFVTSVILKDSMKKILISLFLVSLCILLSFIFTIILTTYKNSNNSDSFSDSFKILEKRILYNFNLIDENEYKIYYCDEKDTNCVKEATKFSNVSRIETLTRYFIFRNFLPLLGNFENLMSKEFKNDLFKIAYFREYKLLFNLHNKHEMKNFIPILVTSINSFIFLSIVILTLYQSIKI